MKSLLLKDIYNLSHNAKSMLLLLLVFAFWLIPTSGPSTYVITCAVLCSMMIVTTFVFDDFSKWTKYALIMPITKKDVVLGKFCALGIFSFAGIIVGFIIGLIGGIITGKIGFHLIDILSLLGVMLFGFVIAIFLGSIVIPLIIKFGSAQSRVLTIGAFVVPIGLIYGIYQIGHSLHIKISDNTTTILILISPIIAIAIIYLMYRISCVIFSKKELQN